MIALLTLILGLAIGFYGRKLYDYVKSIYDLLQYKFDSHSAGVVKPEVNKITKAEPINLEASETGGVRRPSPEQILINNARARDARLKQL